jgi:hypothetical protein
MYNLKKVFSMIVLFVCLIIPKQSKADLFGGDVAVLAQLLANAIQQLYQLKAVVSNGDDTFNLLNEINRGIRDGLNVIRIINPKFNPGIYGNLDTADQVLRIIGDLYGRIPQTSESRLQEAQDQSVSEGIAMNGTLYRYADQVDEESKRILAHSKEVSPQGAGKLTAQSVAVLIGVTTQMLRTNSMMLKMMSENMALQNRKEKIASSQFRTQYDGISHALGSTPFQTDLPSLTE